MTSIQVLISANIQLNISNRVKAGIFATVTNLHVNWKITVKDFMLLCTAAHAAHSPNQ